MLSGRKTKTRLNLTPSQQSGKSLYKIPHYNNYLETEQVFKAIPCTLCYTVAWPGFVQNLFFGKRFSLWMEGGNPYSIFFHIIEALFCFFSFFGVGGGVQKYHLALLVPFQILFGPFWLKNHRQRWKSENPALAQRSSLLCAILSKYLPGSKIPVSFPQYVKV